MADWEHKEASWSDDGLSGKFSSWLNKQCKGGWEVFKISRNFSSYDDYTWCVFRRRK